MDIRKVYVGITEEASKSARVLFLVQVAQAVMIPAFIAYAVNLASGSDPTLKPVGWIFTGCLISVQAILLLAVLSGPTTPTRIVVAFNKLVKRLEDSGDAYHELRIQRDSYFSAVACASKSLNVLRGILDARTGPVSADERQKQIKEILQPYIAERDTVFNFTNDTGTYTMAVFLYDEEMQKLRAIYSHKDPELESHGQRRDWSPHGSHVGLAYQQKKLLITGDVSALSSVLTESFSEKDVQIYRAMASVPVYCKNEVVGALSVTGNRPNQFSYDNASETFETIGRIISLYLSYTTIEEQI